MLTKTIITAAAFATALALSTGAQALPKGVSGVAGNPPTTMAPPSNDSGGNGGGSGGHSHGNIGGHGDNNFFNSYGAPHLSCSDASRTLRARGFKNIKTQACGYGSFTFTAKRAGHLYLLELAQNGQFRRTLQIQ